MISPDPSPDPWTSLWKYRSDKIRAKIDWWVRDHTWRIKWKLKKRFTRPPNTTVLYRAVDYGTLEYGWVLGPSPNKVEMLLVQWDNGSVDDVYTSALDLGSPVRFFTKS